MQQKSRGVQPKSRVKIQKRRSNVEKIVERNKSPGLGFRVSGFGFEVRVLGFGIWGLRLRVSGVGFGL